MQPAATSDYAEETARIAFSLSNDERIEAGLSPLTWDASLAAIARAHSADMLARNYFEHVNPEGCSSSCRATNAGYSWRMIGENIYMTHGYAYGAAEEAETVVEGWMRSPGHKANILGAKYTHSGVGVAFQGDTAYITALYSLPR